TPGIHDAYVQGVDGLLQSSTAREVARGATGESQNACQTGLFLTSAKDFMSDETLQAEVFGATSLVVECTDLDEVKHVAESLEGQLTATLQMDEDDLGAARLLLPVLERRAGRVMANGWPTGVEVCHAMVHGGPYPATSDSRTTSVGSAAIYRFLRPVCYQDLPQGLLPEALRDGNTAGVSRLIDGHRET
ncbi:aldehyde dehydrogenase (NADP(+)), partial [Cobetia amphilecti]